MDATRADTQFTAEVIQIAIDEGATTINIPDTGRLRDAHEYATFLTDLYELVPGAQRRHPLHPLPRRPRPRCGEQLRRRPGGRSQVECAINGIGERAGNASLERS
jgi:2-isopropylmalate synthase